MKKALAVILLPSLVFLSACTSYSAAPNSEAVTVLPNFPLIAFHGKAVQITVEDMRPDAVDTSRLKRQLTSDLTTALTRAGATVDPSAPNLVQVRVSRLRADAGNRQWEGCGTINATVRFEGKEPKTVRGDRCSTTSTWAGMHPNQAALNKAYRDTLADLLSQLDTL